MSNLDFAVTLQAKIFHFSETIRFIISCDCGAFPTNKILINSKFQPEISPQPSSVHTTTFQPITLVVFIIDSFKLEKDDVIKENPIITFEKCFFYRVHCGFVLLCCVPPSPRTPDSPSPCLLYSPVTKFRRHRKPIASIKVILVTHNKIFSALTFTEIKEIVKIHLRYLFYFPCGNPKEETKPDKAPRR